MKDPYLHHLLEHQEDIVYLGVVGLPKALLNSCDDLVVVPWCLGILEGFNGVE